MSLDIRILTRLSSVWLERSAVDPYRGNRQVPGSNPGGGTIYFIISNIIIEYMTKSKAVKVPLKMGENTKKKLIDIGIINRELLPKREGDFLFLPVYDSVAGFDITESDFKEKRIRVKSYKDIVNIDKNLKNLLPTSYDIIGDIALIKLPEELIPYEEDIGKALMKIHKNISVVCLSKPVKGDYRTRDIEIIAGENRTSTVHREYGMEIEVDVRNTFFSPRLAGERYRVAKRVKDGEVIVDMFTGVAPFSIMIARYSSPEIIYAIDKNEKAIEFAKRNVTRNRALDKIEVIHGDSRDVLKKLKREGVKADRIVMNLPFLSYKFLPDALSIADEGCVIHYYEMLSDRGIIERTKSLHQKSREFGLEIDVENIKKIKSYSPREFYTGFDIRVKKPA